MLAVVIDKAYVTSILGGKKKVIISDVQKNFGDSRVLLVSKDDRTARAGMILGHPRIINLTDFSNLYDDHRVRDSERRRRWPWKRSLFLYTIDDLVKYDEPQKVILRTGSIESEFAEEVKFKGSGNKNAALIVDLDGTVRTTTGDSFSPRGAKEVKAFSAVGESLKTWKEMGYLLLAVTNQGGVSSGRLTEEEFRSALKETEKQLGIIFDGVKVEFDRNNSARRKPSAVMGKELEEEFDLSLPHSFYSGDLKTDKEFAENLGIAFIEAEDLVGYDPPEIRLLTMFKALDLPPIHAMSDAELQGNHFFAHNMWQRRQDPDEAVAPIFSSEEILQFHDSLVEEMEARNQIHYCPLDDESSVAMLLRQHNEAHEKGNFPQHHIVVKKLLGLGMVHPEESLRDPMDRSYIESNGLVMNSSQNSIPLDWDASKSRLEIPISVGSTQHGRVEIKLASLADQTEKILNILAWSVNKSARDTGQIVTFVDQEVKADDPVAGKICISIELDDIKKATTEQLFKKNPGTFAPPPENDKRYGNPEIIAPSTVQKFLEGPYIQVHSTGKGMKFFDEAGKDVTKILSFLIDRLNPILPSKGVFDAALMSWVGRDTVPKAQLQQRLDSDNLGPNASLVVYDTPYLGKDLSAAPYQTRFSALKELPWPQEAGGRPSPENPISLLLSEQVDTEQEFPTVFERVKMLPGSIGAKILPPGSPYTSPRIVYPNHVIFTAKVAEKVSDDKFKVALRKPNHSTELPKVSIDGESYYVVNGIARGPSATKVGETVYVRTDGYGYNRKQNMISAAINDAEILGASEDPIDSLGSVMKDAEKEDTLTSFTEVKEANLDILREGHSTFVEITNQFPLMLKKDTVDTEALYYTNDKFSTDFLEVDAIKDSLSCRAKKVVPLLKENIRDLKDHDGPETLFFVTSSALADSDLDGISLLSFLSKGQSSKVFEISENALEFGEYLIAIGAKVLGKLNRNKEVFYYLRLQGLTSSDFDNGGALYPAQTNLEEEVRSTSTQILELADTGIDHGKGTIFWLELPETLMPAVMKSWDIIKDNGGEPENMPHVTLGWFPDKVVNMPEGLPESITAETFGEAETFVSRNDESVKGIWIPVNIPKGDKILHDLYASAEEELPKDTQFHITLGYTDGVAEDVVQEINVVAGLKAVVWDSSIARSVNKSTLLKPAQDEDKKYKYVIQRHLHGKNGETDFRFETDDHHLLGWTLADLKPDGIKSDVASLRMAREVSEDAFKIDLDVGKFKQKRILSVPKGKIPVEWLTQQGKLSDNLGYMLIKGRGTVEFGIQKEGFHEYFLKGKGLSGKLTFNRLPDTEEEKWIAQNNEDLPKILKGDKPDHVGRSYLPSSMKSQIPKNIRYWEMSDEATMLKAHKALMKRIRKGKITLTY